MVARLRHRRMGCGKLEAGCRSVMRAGWACGTRWAASNPGGQGVLQGRGESFGRVCAATGHVRMWGGNKD
jgi:hypothetical protein